MVPRKRKVSLLSGDSLKNLGVAAGLIVTLWQGFQSGRKADAAGESATAAAAYAGSLGDVHSATEARLMARVDALERRVRLLQRGVTVPNEVTLYGPQTKPPGWKPQSHGMLWKMLHPFGR